MARYIDAEKILFERDTNFRLVVSRDWINNIPTADVQPIIHAKWIKGRYGDDTDYSICSNCKSLHNRWISYRYCPDCGAKMDKEC